MMRGGRMETGVDGKMGKERRYMREEDRKKMEEEISELSVGKIGT